MLTHTHNLYSSMECSVCSRGIGMTIEVTRAARTSPLPPILTLASCLQSDFYATEAGRQHFTVCNCTSDLRTRLSQPSRSWLTTIVCFARRIN